MKHSSSRTIPSRRILTVAVAVLTTLMMLTVPAMVSMGSDASFADDKAGIVVTLDNPTDDEIEKYKAESRYDELWYASELFMDIFNMDVYGHPKLTSDSYFNEYSEALKIESDSTTPMNYDGVSADGVKFVFTATEDGKLITDEDLEGDYKDAAQAVESYFGSEIYAGDTLTVTGKVGLRFAFILVYEWTAVDDTHYVEKKGAYTGYRIYDLDVKVELIRNGESEGKSIQFSSDSRFMVVMDINYDYKGTSYSDLTPESPCTVSYGDQGVSFQSGGSRYTVDGADHSIKYKADRPSSYDTKADLRTNEDMTDMMAGFRDNINDFPDSSGNVTVDKTYDAADNVFDDMIIDVIGQEIIDIIKQFFWVFIAIGIITAIAIVALVIAVTAKNRK